MKICFIYPAYENLGIEYLSAALKQSGHDTYLILDPNLFAESGGINLPGFAKPFDYSNYILRNLADSNPDLICLSCVSDNFRWAIRIAGNIKKYFSIPIVFGGIHPTSVPEVVISHESVDFVCVGEGEKAITGLARSISEGIPTGKIPNIWRKEGKTIIPNEVDRMEEDLDSLPFADKDLYYKKYKFMFDGYTIITSRGCPHSCTYCANNLLRNIYSQKGKYLRRRSPGNVMDELFMAKKKYGPRFVHFSDEVFTHDRKWLEEFIPRYKKEIGLPFSCYTSPQFASREVAGILKDGGCHKVQMGVQSLDEKQRVDLLHRHYTNEQVASAIRSFRNKKIYITCDNIFGLPGQDKKELVGMAEFYARNTPNHIEVFWLRYYPRTEICKIAEDRNFIDSAKIRSLEDPIDTIGIARGGDSFNPEYSRFQLLFNLFHFLPVLMRSFLVKIKIYNVLPPLRPIFITVVFRLFNKARYDIYASSTARRYAHFVTKNIYNPFINAKRA